jgi:hypothetical protein
MMNRVPIRFSGKLGGVELVLLLAYF